MASDIILTATGQERRANLISEMEKMGEIFESKIIRRRNLVPKKFTTLKIKDVLTIERDHKIKMFELIKEVEKLKKQPMKSQDHLYKEMERIRNQRKQSITGKVQR